MPELRVRYYDSFAERPRGGNPAAVVLGTEGLDPAELQSVAAELNVNTTAFPVGDLERGLAIRFFTAEREIDLCGHALLAAVAALVDDGSVTGRDGIPESFEVRSAAGTIPVEPCVREGRFHCAWLGLGVPAYVSAPTSRERAARALGLDPRALEPALPLEIATTGLRHLVVPLRSLVEMRRLAPDFRALRLLSERLEVQSVAPATRETVEADSTFHGRDLCPAIGNDEESASGTTNVALAGYLQRHGLLGAERDGTITAIGEQGYELNRPSRVRVELRVAEGSLTAARAGGGAIRVLEGRLSLDGVPA